MAVAAELLLLVALISNLQAEILEHKGSSYKFLLDKKADFCSISRWTGAEPQLLWNSSAPHLENEAAYQIPYLKFSDSGRYQEQCWTRGSLTHERNLTLLVCDVDNSFYQLLYLEMGQTLELTCDAAGPDGVQWGSNDGKHSKRDLELTLVEDGTFSVPGFAMVKHKSSVVVTARTPDQITKLYCLERVNQRCHVPREVFFRSVAQSVLCSGALNQELTCTGISGAQPKWTLTDRCRNFRLRPVLTLHQTSGLICSEEKPPDSYYDNDLYVCPGAEPPAEVIFTRGGNLTLPCGGWNQTNNILWFTRTQRTKGRLSYLHKNRLPGNMHPSEVGLLITDVSLEDSGEFWCVVRKEDQCVFMSKTLVRAASAQ